MTEKRCVVAPHDVDVSPGLFVSTVGYDADSVRGGSGDAVGGFGSRSVKRTIVRAQEASSAGSSHPETYSTQNCPRLSTLSHHSMIPASEWPEIANAHAVFATS